MKVQVDAENPNSVPEPGKSRILVINGASRAHAMKNTTPSLFQAVSMALTTNSSFLCAFLHLLRGERVCYNLPKDCSCTKRVTCVLLGVA